MPTNRRSGLISAVRSQLPLKPSTGESLGRVRLVLFLRDLNFEVKTGFSHCTKMVPVKSHNDFSRPLVEKGVV